MKQLEADLVVVGSAISGLFASQDALAGGLKVVMVERGSLKTHEEQLKDGSESADGPGAAPNNETAPGTPEYPWNYVYGVGGSSLHWDGVTPRFRADDMRMRTAYGVMVDWPLSADDLRPFYRRAELALGVAGSPDWDSSGPREKLLPPHPLSPMDKLIADALSPYGPLPQARPSEPVAGRPACCGSARCNLCPIDSRFSALNGMKPVLESLGSELLTETAAARVNLTAGGSRVRDIEAVTIRGERGSVFAAERLSWLQEGSRIRRSSSARDWTDRRSGDICSTTGTEPCMSGFARRSVRVSALPFRRERRPHSSAVAFAPSIRPPT